MIDNTQPWLRIKNPSAVPNPCTGVGLRTMDDGAFAHLLASQLVPGEDRDGHQVLWVTLAFNDDLAERAFDVMEEWLDACEAQLADTPGGRPQKFAGFVQGAWDRLTLIRDRDLGPKIAVPPDPESVTGRLLLAIETHQAATTAPTAVDYALWAVPGNARSRRLRNDKSHEESVTKHWKVAPSFTKQLIQAVHDHADLSDDVPRPADEELWGLLDELS